MAVTPVGNPYVESSDLVANYPGASEALAERIDIVGVNPFANAAARDAAIPSPVQGQMCSLNDDNKGYRYDGSAWILFSGAGNANFTNVATGTYTDDEGISYKFLTATGSLSLIVDKAGFADVLLLGGGGGSGNDGGGGAGGFIYETSFYLPAGTHSVTIGAGGAALTKGGVTRLLSLFAIGGGFGQGASGNGGNGASGGGASRTGTGGLALLADAGLGFAGGNGGATYGGAGGGSAGVGENAGQDGGPGTSNSITNTATFYAAGGNTYNGVDVSAGRTPHTTNGANNSGSGAGAGGRIGGSGRVIVRVAV